MPYCLANICEWAGTLEIDIRVPTNHLLPRFLSPSMRKGPGRPQEPRESLELHLSCPPSESSLHAIGSSETGVSQGTSPLDCLRLGDPTRVSHPAGSPTVLNTSTSRRPAREVLLSAHGAISCDHLALLSFALMHLNLTNATITDQIYAHTASTGHQHESKWESPSLTLANTP